MSTQIEQKTIQEPTLKGLVQIKNPDGTYTPIGKASAFKIEPIEGKTRPTYKVYVGIMDKEFFEISLW